MKFRASYQSDSALCDRVFSLLETTFPGVGQGRVNADRFGVPWEAGSTPFVVEDRGAVVAHVGLLEIPMRIEGRDVAAGGVHGVATHPQYRGRGYFRSLMEELLAYAAPRHDHLLLTTLHPEYFASFGFRTIAETIGVADDAQPPTTESRGIDLSDPNDLALIHRLIESRTPLSDDFGVGPERCCWGFVEFGSTIRYSDRWDVAAVAEVIDRTLRVYDVISRRVPSAAEIASMWAQPIDRTLFFVPTDKIAGPIRLLPHDLGGGPDAIEPGTSNWVMMVRGPGPKVWSPVFLPRSARC